MSGGPEELSSLQEPSEGSPASEALRCRLQGMPGEAMDVEAGEWKILAMASLSTA